MAWLPDEIHEFYEDCKDKKSTAQSARHARTHNGRRGKVKFASDYMTKKEREAMNGKCVSYRMNDPISWEEFKTWPDEHKITYIKLLRKKYNVPDKYIAEMMGISRPQLCKYIVDLGLGTGKGHGGVVNKASNWDREGFYAWWHGAEIEVVEDDTCDNDHTCSYASDCSEKMIRDAGMIAFAGNSVPVIPSRGTLTFDNNSADDALATIKTLLGGMRVSMTITWFQAE